MTRCGRRSIVAMAVGALVGSGALVIGPTSPVIASGSPHRYWAASANDVTGTKTVTVSCPGLGRVYGAGAMTVGGGGGVVLNEMRPDPGLTSVTVTATARTGYQPAWSIVAHATCDVSAAPPMLVTATAHVFDEAEATCPGQTRLFGTGFRIQGGVDHSFVDAVAFDVNLRKVRVHAGGTGTPQSVTAYAICKDPSPPTGSSGARVTATSTVDPIWPKAATVTGTTLGGRMFGVGAVVESSGEAFLSALVPFVAQNSALAVAVRASPLPPAIAQGGPPAAPLAGGSLASDLGSVTVYGTEAGTFH